MSDAVAREGFVTKVFKNESKPDAARAWRAYSFKIVNAAGVEDPMFYRLGFCDDPSDPSPFTEDTDGKGGDYVKFQATPVDDKAMQVVPDSGEIVDNPPARTAPEKKKSGGNRGGYSGGGGAKSKMSDLFGEIGGYNTEEDIKRISYTAARTAALVAVGYMLDNDALPLAGGKSPTAAHKAKRFEEISNAIDKFTVEYFGDVTKDFRKLATVADAGTVDTSPDTQLPDQDEVYTESEAEGESGPPPDDDDVVTDAAPTKKRGF